MSEERSVTSRRQFLESALAGAAALGMIPRIAPAEQSAAQKGKRYNILLIQCDSMDGRVMGCMGDPSAYTPNLDRLAGQGVLFANTYCNSPLCVPSRASMLSGLHTHKCEAWNNNKGLDAEALVNGGKGAADDSDSERRSKKDKKAAKLEKKGKTATRYSYQGLAPKDHNYYMDFEDGGCLLECFGKNDFQSGGHTVFARVGAWTRSSGVRLPMIKGQKFEILKPKGDPRKVKETDWKKKDECQQWLAQYAAGGKQQPFVLYCGLTYPHPAYRTSEYWWSKIDPAKITVPPKDKEPLHPGVEYLKIIKSADRDFDKELVIGLRRTYRAMVAEVDCIVGELLKQLEELGLRDSTYVIFTSDHGDMQMEHNLTHKQCLFEGAVRVPLVIAGPGVRRGAVVQDLVSLVDMYPALMDMAGLPTPSGLDGRSLVPLLTGGSDPGRPDWVLSQYHGDYCNTGCFMLRQGDWKYIAWAGYPPQLFNLKRDPWEIDNCAGDHPEIARKMDAKLHEIADPQAVDAKVKAYDKASFRKWRAEQSEKAYREFMAELYGGFTDQHQKIIDEWIAKP